MCVLWRRLRKLCSNFPLRLLPGPQSVSTATAEAFWPLWSFPPCARKISITGTDRESAKKGSFQFRGLVGVAGLTCLLKITHYVAFPTPTCYETLSIQILHIHLLILKASLKPSFESSDNFRSTSSLPPSYLCFRTLCFHI